MKTGRVIGIAAISLLIIGNAYATSWFIFNSFPAPAPEARSVSHDSPYMFSLLCDGDPPRIFDLGQPVYWLYLNNIPPGVSGLTCDSSGYIYVSNSKNSYIYRLSPAASLLSSFRGPRNHPADLGFSGYLVIAYPEENVVVETNMAGSIANSYVGPGVRVTGVSGVPWSSRMVATDPVTGLVYFQWHGTFQLQEPISVWNDFFTTREVPYTDIVVVDAANNYIYIIDSLNAEGVAPASLGRIKALLW